jgi:hypothetical protein
MDDIFAYAEGRVNNKGILARIGHSPKLHSARSATTSKGSFGSKAASLAGVAVRAGLSAIPIPQIGGLIGKIEQAVEGQVRTWHHNKRGKGATSIADTVKFSLKELSVENLDRYRKKVEMSVNDLNKAGIALEAQVKKKQGEHATCDAYLEMAKAGEQASRRLRILRETIVGLQTSLALTTAWANKVECGLAGSTEHILPESVLGVKNETRKFIMTQISGEMTLFEKAYKMQPMNAGGQGGMTEEFIAEYHGKCGQWCCFRAQGTPDNFQNAKKRAAMVTRFLTDPFTIEDIIGVGMEDYSSGDG